MTGSLCSVQSEESPPGAGGAPGANGALGAPGAKGVVEANFGAGFSHVVSLVSLL